MSLLNGFLSIIFDWRSSFAREASYQRAFLFAISSLCVFGRACISRMICLLGLDQRDWSAHYKFFSRSPWKTQQLFDSITKKALPLIEESYIAVAFDDTKLKKTGKKIKTAFYQRDPLSPPFHVNLFYGLRFLQGSLLMPLYRTNNQPPRSLPIAFNEVPPLKKPGARATDEQREKYKALKKVINLSTAFVQCISEVRDSLDKAGGTHKTMIAVVDGSFCNRICMGAHLDRIALVARARKDAKLCFEDMTASRAFYAKDKFCPEEVRQNDSIVWQKAEIYHGGRFREIRFKEVKDVLWQRGTLRRKLKLLVIAPTPYRLTKKGRMYYRRPAYLLCREASEINSTILIQKYFDRWQIEVNHREEKDILGVGQAQVRAEKSVPRQPALVVAAYSALLLAGVICYGDIRGKEFIQLPKWRKNAKRPSCQDLVNLLRKEVIAREGWKIDSWNAILKSAA